MEKGKTPIVQSQAPPHLQCPTTFESFFRHSLSTYSSRLFIIEPSHDVRLTFGQIYTRARALGADLQSRGFGQGSRIAIGGRNSAQYINANTCDANYLGGLSALSPYNSLAG